MKKFLLFCALLFTSLSSFALDYGIHGISTDYRNQKCICGNYFFCYWPDYRFYINNKELTYTRSNYDSYKYLLYFSAVEGSISGNSSDLNGATYLTCQWTTHTPCTLAPSTFEISRWERSYDNGTT